MKFNFRKIIVLFSLCALGLGSRAFAQQITKFAVVDTSRVYQAFFRNSSQIRTYEKKKTEFQNEITKVTQEIQNLHTKKLDYESKGDSTNADKIQGQIEKRTEYLTEYTRTKNEELQNLRTNMQKNDDFYKKLYSVLEKVAEAEGYSMVLSLQQNNAILWYSPSVDITDQVISELGLKNN